MGTEEADRQGKCKARQALAIPGAWAERACGKNQVREREQKAKQIDLADVVA